MPTPAASEDDQIGYQPFPAFASWYTTFDSGLVDRFAHSLQELRQHTTAEAMDAAVKVAARYAAVDTGAIEGLYATNRGFTRTIAEQTATWEAALKQHGPHVERSITDALNAYEMVLDLVTGQRELTESWIRQLHSTICHSQETHEVLTSLGLQKHPFSKGEYKKLPNNPTNFDTGRIFHYAPATDTPAEMARLISEVHTPEFRRAHQIVQAAYVHYAFVRIHPFADGNGRVSRALAAVFLYPRPINVPLVIFADQKPEYLDSLEAAVAGSPETFVRFIAARVVDTIELVRLALSTPDEAPTSLTNFSHYADEAEERIIEESIKLMNFLQERIPHVVDSDIALPERVGFEYDYASFSGSLDREPHTIAYRFLVWKPLYMRHESTITLRRSHERESGFLLTGGGSNIQLQVFSREISPLITESLRMKMDAWLRAILIDERNTFLDTVEKEFLRKVHPDNKPEN